MKSEQNVNTETNPGREVHPALTKHALLQASSRNISERAVDLALRYGKLVRRRGALIFYLGARHIPAALRADARVRRCEGTTVVVSNDGQTVVTVYRNRNGLN